MAWRNERRGDHLVAVPSGSIDHERSEDLYDLLVAAVRDAAESGGKLVLDLAGVSYMSSAGLRALTRAARLGQENSVAILVANLNGTMAEIFEITRFDKLFRTFDSVKSALDG